MVRLMDSLQRASFNDQKIDLIISADLPTPEITEYLSQLNWKHGEIKIKVRDPKLGLLNHMVTSVSEALSVYNSVIVLEDDVVVSNHFYHYAEKATEFYYDEPHVAGISLYSYYIAENSFNSFIPLNNSHDTFFMQVASSWGEIFTKSQWDSFSNWLEQKPENVRLPGYVKQWSEHSWKKMFVEYLISQNLFVVYPYISLSSNFADKGENVPTSLDLYQTPLLVNKKQYSFCDFTEKAIKYDAYFEMLPSCFGFTNELIDKDFVVDLRGSKHLVDYKNKYWLTTKPCKNPVKTYGLNMIPKELNILFDIRGKEVSLCLQENISDRRSQNKLESMNLIFQIFHGIGNSGSVFMKFFCVKFHFASAALKRSLKL